MLSDPELELWEALLRVHASLVPKLAKAVEDSTGLPLSWYDVLLELSRSEEGRLRMQDLSGRVVLSRSRVSRVVDAMEDAGLVEREPDPIDGRATLAKMTPSGRTAFGQAAPVYTAGIRENLRSLDPETVRAVNKGLHALLRKML